MRQFMTILKGVQQPGTILFASEDNLEWLFEDYAFTKELQGTLIDIIQRGFTICQIMPSVNFLNRYVESLRYWLPIYITGQVKVYYYPRLRDNLFRHFYAILPGHCVLSSTGVSMESNFITLLSADPTLVKESTAQYNDYLSLCRPALTLHETPNEFIPFFRDFFFREESSIQKVNPLSTNTLPEDLLAELIEKTTNPIWKDTYQLFLEEIPRFQDRLQRFPFIDIGELATAEEIRAHKVPIGTSYKTYEGQACYTPKTYILHLQNILRLMDKYENYYFVPASKESRHDYNLLVNNSGLALLVRNTSPTLMLEIKRPEMVQACREHLLRMAEHLGCDGIKRTKTRMQ